MSPDLVCDHGFLVGEDAALCDPLVARIGRSGARVIVGVLIVEDLVHLNGETKTWSGSRRLTRHGCTRSLNSRLRARDFLLGDLDRGHRFWVSSVILFNDIPENPSDSWFHGQVVANNHSIILDRSTAERQCALIYKAALKV